MSITTRLRLRVKKCAMDKINENRTHTEIAFVVKYNIKKGLKMMAVLIAINIVYIHTLYFYNSFTKAGNCKIYFVHYISYI